MISITYICKCKQSMQVAGNVVMTFTMLAIAGQYPDDQTTIVVCPFCKKPLVRIEYDGITKEDRVEAPRQTKATLRIVEDSPGGRE